MVYIYRVYIYTDSGTLSYSPAINIYKNLVEQEERVSFRSFINFNTKLLLFLSS